MAQEKKRRGNVRSHRARKIEAPPRYPPSTRSAKRGSEERAILGQRADAIEEEALQLYILRDKELKEIEEINVEMEEERTVRSTSFDVVLRGYPSKDWSMSDSDLWFSKHPDADLGPPSSVFRTDLRQFQSFLI